MGKRDVISRKEERARGAARQLTLLLPLRGVPCVDRGRLWLIRDCTWPIPTPEGLAVALRNDALLRLDHLKPCLGFQNPLPVDLPLLSHSMRALAELEASPLEHLLAEGARPLKRHRHLDLPEVLADRRRSLERLGVLLRSLPSYLRCQLPDPDLSDLLDALPLRLHALASWEHDPVEELCRRSVRADGPLLLLARNNADSIFAQLAAILLGIRQGRSRHRDGSLESLLPAALRRAFRVGLGACAAPCLFAHLLATMPSASAPPGPARLTGPTPGRIAERVALLRGVSAGLDVLFNLVGPSQDDTALTARIDDFVAAAIRVTDKKNRSGLSSEEQQLESELHTLEAPARLVQRFRSWMVGRETLRPEHERPLLRAARSLKHGGLAGAARAVGRVWADLAQQPGFVAYRVNEECEKARLALSLAVPGVRLPSYTSPQHLDTLRDLLADLPSERAGELFPALLRRLQRDDPGRWSWDDLIATGLPANLVERAIHLGVAEAAGRFRGKPGEMAQYLDCVESLRDHPIANLDATAPWLVGFFLLGKSWASGAVLVLLSRERSKETDPAALFALSRQLTAGGPLSVPGQQVAEALEHWHTLPDQPLAGERAALADLLGVEHSVLREHLHHRRLLGHGDSIAQSLLEPLRQKEAEAREAEFLKRQLAETGPATNRRPHLAERLRRLTAADLKVARRAHVVERTRARLERSLVQLRRDSLEHILDKVARSSLEKLLGPLHGEGPLPAGLRDALRLLDATETDPQLWVSFLRDVLEQRSLKARPANRDWLTRATAAGIDMSAWLSGVHETVQIGEEVITFSTERDPLHVLKMGCYFDTCLDLNGGCYAASTLCNALDVNKQVIYGRRADGAVVARKLIGATLKRELAGYRTYATEHPDEVRRALHGFLSDFAQRCRLRPSGTATPENLNGAFWYDDGNEAWDVRAALELPPPELPRDPGAVSEWNLVRALEEDDLGRLRLVALEGVSPWRDAAQAHLLRHQPGAIVTFREEAERDGLHWLIWHGELAWLEAAPQHGKALLPGSLVRLHDALPCDPVRLDEGLARLTHAVRQVAHGTIDVSWLQSPSDTLALASTSRLLDFLRAVAGRATPTMHRMSVDQVIGWTDVLEMVWLRDGQAGPFVRALEDEHKLLTELVARLGSRTDLPGLAPGLRRCLKARRGNQDDVALALGTQGDPGDGPLLLKALESDPCSLNRALAVVRCGHEPSAIQARQFWSPPATLETLPRSPCWLARARELASPRLTRRLLSLLRREIEGCLLWGTFPTCPERGTLETCPTGSAAFLCRALVLTSLPAELASATRLFESLSRHFPEARLIEEVQGKLERFDVLAARFGSSGASRDLHGCHSLSTGKAMSRFLDKEMAVLWQHRGFDQGVRRLAARGTPAERVRALTAWGEGVALWLGLVGENRFSLDPVFRVAQAHCVIEKLTLPHNGSALESALAWLEGLPEERQLEHWLSHADFFSPTRCCDPTPIPLAALEDPTSTRGRALEVMLDAWGRTKPLVLLEWLHAFFVWLTPTRAAELARTVLDRVSVSTADFLGCKELLDIGETARSYRVQRLLLDHFRPRLDEQQRRELDAWLAEQDGPRMRWLYRQLQTAPLDSRA